jgi:hypothetical protein
MSKQCERPVAMRRGPPAQAAARRERRLAFLPASPTILISLVRVIRRRSSFRIGPLPAVLSAYALDRRVDQVVDAGIRPHAHRAVALVRRPPHGSGGPIVVAVVDRVVPPALQRAVRTGVGFPARGSCSLLFPAVPPAEQDMREVRTSRRGWCGTGGVPLVVHSGAFPARVVHRFRFSAPRVRHSCCASSSDDGLAEGSGGRGGACRGVSRRRGCGCATGWTG